VTSLNEIDEFFGSMPLVVVPLEDVQAGLSRTSVLLATDVPPIMTEPVDEEVPTIKRKVAYVCDACAGCGPVARGTGSCCDERCGNEREGWWTRLTSVWKFC
jgi:hypothetical protein